MKIAFVLIFALSLSASASSKAQNVPVSLNVKNASIQQVFSKLTKQTGYNFLCDATAVKGISVTLNVVNTNLKDVLSRFLDPQQFEIVFGEDKTVIIKRRERDNAFIQQSDIMITGRVTDSKNKPLFGATIAVKGAQVATSTDATGNFKIPVANNDAILVVSFVGFTSREIPVKNSTDFRIVLMEANNEIDQVVVVGYGTKKKVDLTGAISVVKGTEIENRPVLNATQSLQGMVPGLNVSVGSNTKPGQSYNLNIRGAGNIAGGDVPYVLVDGIAMDLSTVNPNDIESISVLKDAAASAVYGARAPYGVILVTTKKGTADRTVINYSGNYGFTSPVKLPEMVNSYDFATYVNLASTNGGGATYYDDASLARLKQYQVDPKGMPALVDVGNNNYYGWALNGLGVGSSDWFAFHYKPYATRQQHNVSVSGGNKATQYYVSGGYYGEDGILRYADIGYKRYNLNASVSSQLTRWATVKLNTKFQQAQNKSPFDGTFEGYFFHDLGRQWNNMSAYDMNGNFSEMSYVPYLQSGSYDKLNNYNIVLLPSLELQPVKDWKINVDLNLSRNNNEENVLKLPALIKGIDGTAAYRVSFPEFGIPLTGSYARYMNTNMYVSPNIYSSYNYTLKEDHNFSVMAGFQQELNQYNALVSSVQDLISFERPGLSLATSAATTTETRNHWATRGFFGRFNYNYKEKYLLEVNGRYDGSSRFAPDHRWGFFPSASIGYNIAKEDFMKDLVGNKINTLKLRASYGLLGNQAGAGMYAYTQTMGITVPGTNGAGGQWYFQNGREAYIGTPAAYNPLITWEKVRTANVGLDFELFKNHLSGTFDVYQRDTKDMLGPTADIADMYGGTVPNSNNANLRNRGWELSLAYKGKINEDISYSVGGALSDYTVVVTKYQNPTKLNPAGAWYEGKHAGEIWGFKAESLIQNQKEADDFNKLDHSYLTAQQWKPGDLNYLDINSDGKINRGSNVVGDMGDMAVIGNTTPRYAYSFNGSISWKGLSLYMFLQGIGKRDYSPGVGDVYFWGTGALSQVTVFKQHLDYWTPTNPNAYYPNPYSAGAGSVANYTNKSEVQSTRYLQSAAYLRLKNITLSYSLPADLINRIKLKKVNVFVTGENLFTTTKLAKMFDPETLSGAQGTGKMYPLSKIISMGANITL